MGAACTCNKGRSDYMKESIALVFVGLAGLYAMYLNETSIAITCFVALIAYVGGNHNGELRNKRLAGQDEPPPLVEKKDWVK